MVITGEHGELRWSYYQAAVLRPWTMSQADGQLTLSATIASRDGFRVSQRPLKFVTKQMAWPVTELQITGVSLTATLGPRE